MFFKKIGLLSLLLCPLALASGYSTDGCTTAGSISSAEDMEENMESFLHLQAVSIATDSEDSEYEDSDFEDTNSQTRHKGKSLSLGANDLLSPQLKLAHTYSLPIISPDPKSIVTRRIAVVGSGVGSMIAVFLSNLSEETRFDGLRLEITLFESNPEIINGSVFGDIAAVLHGGGREYPMDADTAADCQTYGALFECMFPGLYDTSTPIMYFSRTDSDLTPEIQQKAHKMARQKRKKRGLPITPREHLSQSDLPPEKVQRVFGASLSGGVKSTKDKPMKIFERNGRIRKCINESRNIHVETGAYVSRVIKNEDGTFNVLYNKSAGVYDDLEDSMSVMEIKSENKLFDHVLVAASNGNKGILEASRSGAASISSASPEVIVEDRVIAYCDTSNVPPLQNTPLFTLPRGEMLMPLDKKRELVQTALIYRCIEGGSYPESGKTEIDPKEVIVISHGEKILREFKASFKDESSSESRFDKVTLLGAKLHKVVRRAGPLSERRYESPVVTPEGYIILNPFKATYFGRSALDAVKEILQQLPDDSFSELKRVRIEEIEKIVPNREQLFTASTLPRIYTINPRPLTTKEILTEKVKNTEGFVLTQDGKDLLRNYRRELESCEALCRCSSVPYAVPVCEDFEPIGDYWHSNSLFKVKRAISDPYSSHVFGHRKSPATLFDLATSISEKLKQTALRTPLAVVSPLEKAPLRLKLPSTSFESATEDSDTELDSVLYG